MLVIGKRKKSIVFVNWLKDGPPVSGHLLTLMRFSLTNRNNNSKNPAVLNIISYFLHQTEVHI